MLIKAPSFSHLLLDGAPCRFVADHGALYELCQRHAIQDPLLILEGMEKKGWPMDSIWELAWALSYRHRHKNYSGLSYLEFLGLLPVSADFVEFSKLLKKTIYDCLSIERPEDLPPNPPTPLPQDGIGESGSITPPSSLVAH